MGWKRKGIPNRERGPCISKKKGEKMHGCKSPFLEGGQSVGGMLVKQGDPKPNGIRGWWKFFLQLQPMGYSFHPRTQTCLDPALVQNKTLATTPILSNGLSQLYNQGEHPNTKEWSTTPQVASPQVSTSCQADQGVTRTGHPTLVRGCHC